MIAHILARFGLHFMASFMLVVFSYVALRWWWGRLEWRLDTVGMSTEVLQRALRVWRWRGITFAVLCAIPSAFIPPMREIFDVAAGGLLLKSITDYVSWFGGSGVASWLLYRLIWR